MRIRTAAVAGALVVSLLPFVAPEPAGAAVTLQWSQQTAGWNRSSSPTIADVNGDGVNDIVIGHQDGYVRVLDAATGNNLPGWPQPAATRPGAAVPVDSTPAVGDIDRDGANEVVVGAGSTWNRQNGGVVVFRRDGSIKCRHESLNYVNNDNGVYSSPSLGDIDGDTYPDIVFGGWDLYVHALDRNCNELPGFPYMVEDSTWGSPALYDVDGDGRMEIYIGSDQTAGGAIDWIGGEYRALDYVDGKVVEMWKRRTGDVFHSSTAIGDIDGDGDMELVVGGGDFYHHPDGRKIWALNINDGSDQGGWPIQTGGQTNSSPALGDLTGDGIPEVVSGSADGYVRAIRGNGVTHWAVRPRFNTGAGGPVLASPIIADMNGDGVNDVGITNDWGFFVLNGANGAEITALNTWMSSEAAGAVGNFGVQGWKLIVTGFDTPNHFSRLQAYSIPAPGKTPPWPMFRFDARHYAAPNSGGDPLPPGVCRRGSNPAGVPTGGSAPRGYWFLGADGGIFSFGGAPFYGSASPLLQSGEKAVGLQASASGAGYYVLSDRGRIFTFGDARAHGSMEGRPLNAPIIAMAPTPGNNGYWLLGQDGGVFSFGDARFFGSTGGQRLNSPIISMAPTATGNGYWLLAGDGGVFSFGDARFFGSTGGMRLAAPIISMSTSPQGGYWLVALDGGVFSFGVPFYGSIPGIGYCKPPTGLQLRATLTGNGYYLLSLDGGVFSFGDAQFRGSQPGLPYGKHAVDMAIRPA